MGGLKYEDAREDNDRARALGHQEGFNAAVSQLASLRSEVERLTRERAVSTVWHAAALEWNGKVLAALYPGERPESLLLVTADAAAEQVGALHSACASYEAELAKTRASLAAAESARVEAENTLRLSLSAWEAAGVDGPRSVLARLAAAERERDEARADAKNWKGAADAHLDAGVEHARELSAALAAAEEERDAAIAALATRTAQLDATLGTPCEVMALRERVEVAEAEACVVGLREAAARAWKWRTPPERGLLTPDGYDREMREHRESATALEAALTDSSSLAARVLAEAEERGYLEAETTINEIVHAALTKAGETSTDAGAGLRIDRLGALLTAAREERDVFKAYAEADRDVDAADAARLSGTGSYELLAQARERLRVARAAALRGLLAEPSPAKPCTHPKGGHRCDLCGEVIDTAKPGGGA